MGKRPRTPHFITGIGDGNVHEKVHDGETDDVFQLRGNNQQKRGPNNPNYNERNKNNNAYYHYGQDRYNLRAAKNERLQRLEEPLFATGGGVASGPDHWRDVFGNPIIVDPATGRTIGKPSVPTITSGPWQVSAFAFLGMIVVISAIFLHFVSEGTSTSENSSSPYYYRRRQRQRRKHQLRKKKTDEWSDDEEPIQNGLVSDSLLPGRMADKQSIAGTIGTNSPDLQQHPAMYQHPYYYQQPPSNTRFPAQDSRLRRTNNKEPYSPHAGGTHNSGSLHRKDSSGSNYQAPPGILAQHGTDLTLSTTSAAGAVKVYKSPTPNMLNDTNTLSAPRAPQRGISPMNSYSSTGSHGQERQSQAGRNNLESPSGYRSTAPMSGRYRIPSTPDAKDVFRPTEPGGSHHSGKSTTVLPAPPEESPLMMPKSSNPSGHEGAVVGAVPLNDSNISSFPSLGSPEDDQAQNVFERLRTFSHGSTTSSIGLVEAIDATSTHSSHQSSIARMHGSRHQQSLLLSPGNHEETPIIGNARRTIKDTSSFDAAALQPPIGTDDELSPGPYMPYIPSLSGTGVVESKSPRMHAEPPPRSILMDELRLVQMETGNSSIHWEVESGSQPRNRHHEKDFHLSFANDEDHSEDESSENGSDISIPSGDPRKSIVHKRANLTMSTDAATSLQSSINFDELQLQEVIGGGGFGQVWKASWRGTPVAVKVLTGSAQNTHIAKAILEEFKAEINLLKGMRHPNICLYMGACVNPPNRAIITELAANGSVWDALRLPLMAPYIVADGSAHGSWPLRLYVPDHHGAPPSSFGASRVSAPIPPKGTWPWELVKRVACGAARGMAYLHSGHPPVLHRDLKSANLLLDESYTTKVCDFGLSRLKAQARSMTGNCGTVQWMAPEVLANRSYDEKADVYSFGIIAWELLSRECPYEGMTAIQCALAVLNRDKRPEIPKWCPPGLHALIKACVKKEPAERPKFTEIIGMLDAME